MIPAGYLMKRIGRPPGWLAAPDVIVVCSVSNCVNDDIVDLQKAWRHNSFGVANSPAILRDLARESGVDTAGATLFYYEAYDQELESDGWSFDAEAWQAVTPVPSQGVETDVHAPDRSCALRLIGYDVVVFEDYLEHSPLSCNSVAQKHAVNAHCLFSSFDAAKTAIDTGVFGGGCEGGIYKIFSVSIVTDDLARPA